MKSVTLFFFVLIGLFSFNEINAQSLVKPRKSPMAMVKFKKGNQYIKVVYSQPSTNNRKVFGELVPFGQVWRTGANEATEITFTQAVKINGKRVAPGTYTIFSIPNEKDWTIIISKQVGLWGSMNYDSKLDLMRITIKPKVEEETWESFTIKLEEDGTKVNLVIIWDKTSVTLPIDA